ncbi:protein FAM214B-like isoform X2 [Harpia harpyja]|uniref:protein FAM214B-like isoform X2 n=1 Tax=Harpia harpyja TaxID=202280 RepID=UPI0022B091D7|nr:protein FAM214B-like isoform X2 [Harpia harpyja]
MRHIHAETSLPLEHSTDPSLSQPSGEAPLEPSSQRCTHHGILMGYNETEIKVYQVSIFSHLSSSSESTEQQAGRQPAIKRGYPEQRTPEGGRDPKQTHWGGRGVDSKCDRGPGQATLDDDNTFEDSLLVEELSLCGSAQHFSHSGLRVVEHRCEGSPSHSPKASREDKSQDVSSSWHIACSTLHTRDSCPVPLGDQPTDYRDNREQASGYNLLYLDLHNIAQTPQLDSGGKREKPGSSLAHSSRASGEEEWPVVANGCKEPPAPQIALSPEPSNLSSLEKKPWGSSWLGGSSCPAKRKLMPAGKVVADSCSEDETLSPPVRKKRALPCHPVPTACRSTDAKGAPFWNHLLPTAKSSAYCTAVGRRLKSRLHLKSQHLWSSLRRGTRSSTAPWATTTISHVLLGNFEGVIDLEALGKKGYSVPKAGTIQVTLFNPNKTVVKMFLVTYDFQDMPANHMTFLRHRIFLVPMGEEEKATVAPSNPPGTGPPRGVLCYLMHLRFHSSKSGKIYLHNDIRLLFSRKSIEVDSGISYELKSFTEIPRNPCYSPRA